MNFLADISDPQVIALLSIAGGLLLILIIVLVILLKKRKQTGSKHVIIDGVKYDHKSVDDDFTYKHKDIFLERGKEYTVAKGGTIIPGKYQLFAGDERTKYINMRLTGFVREYKSGSSVVLGEGDKITAISHSAILR